ncbi:MAG: hypothetical protein U0525_05220 [Patescibacteria group bacterium]
MDLASIFYILGIIFFVSTFLLFVGIAIFVYRLYTKVTNLKKEAPAKVIGFLQSQNSAGMKAVGVALVGFLLSALKNKISRKKG